MSSRNVHLAPAERAAAAVLYRALQAGRARRDTGERDAEAIRAAVRGVLAAEPLAVVEYVSLADDVTLAELQRVDGPALLSLAVRFGTTRLIDNVAL
jgi:pantoate--beta-alanine ligase